MPAKTKKKPAAKKAKRVAKPAAPVLARWSDSDVKLLMDTVAASRTAREGFEKVAKKLGKSTGTVQQKYYALQRSKKSARAPKVARTAPVPARRNSVSVAGLSNVQLAELLVAASGEMDRRMKAMESNLRVFLG